MYATSGAILRADINSFVEQAAGADKMFIGEQVLPVYSSDVRDGQYPRFNIQAGELLNGDVSTRAPSGSYSRVSREWTYDTFACIDRGIEEPVDDVMKSDLSRFFDSEVNAAKWCLRRIKTAHEIRAAALLMNAGTFSATSAAVTYTQAHVTDGSLDFVADVLGAIATLNGRGVVPNAIVMSNNIYTRVRNSTKLQNYVRGNRPSDATLNIGPVDMAKAFGLDNVFVGMAVKNVAKKLAAAASLSQVWGDTYFWVGQIAAGDLLAGGAGRTIVWNKEGGIWVTETYREEAIRSDIVRVRQHTCEKIIDSNAGQLITTSYA